MNSPAKPASVVKDPVCGMDVNPATAKHTSSHKGTNYYFCCAHCAQKFRADPERYLAPKPQSSQLVTLGAPTPKAPAPAVAASYVCPMCPEVRQSKPGPCPKCGMALEP